MDISVIISTHNRAESLRETIESFLRLEWETETSYELLIVDNNSTDITKDVVAAYMNKNPFIKYVFEEKTGVSQARNKGIKEAKGKIIAFMDDDVELDKNWGMEIVKAFRNNPDVYSIGGKNIPVFPEGKPAWINNDFLAIYGDVKMGEEERYFEFPSHPYGLNMSFRREVFGKIGMFNAELGRRKNILLSNEETGIYYNISRHNLKVLYSPFVIVKHKVPTYRTQKKWILKRHYWQGLSDVVFEQITSKKSGKILLREAYRDLVSVKRGITGNSGISIKKLYWYVRKIKFETWVECCSKLGEIRQKIVEVLKTFNGFP